MAEAPAGRQWVTIPEALAVVGGEARLLEMYEAMLAGDIHTRARYDDGTTEVLSPDELVISRDKLVTADINRPTSWAQISRASSWPKRVWRVEIDKRTLLDYFGAAKTTRKAAGGRPRKWDWERALLGVFGQIYRNEKREPALLADAERLLSEWFVAEYGEEPKSESHIRDHALLLFEEIKKGR